jgi:hypothetical protein
MVLLSIILLVTILFKREKDLYLIKKDGFTSMIEDSSGSDGSSGNSGSGGGNSSFGAPRERDDRPRSFDKPYEKKPYEKKPPLCPASFGNISFSPSLST